MAKWCSEQTNRGKSCIIRLFATKAESQTSKQIGKTTSYDQEKKIKEKNNSDNDNMVHECTLLTTNN
jgi:hypothetical protein